MCKSNFGGLFYLSLINLEAGIADVIGDAFRKKRVLLQSDRDIRSDLRNTYRPNVELVNGNRSLIRVIKPKQQTSKSRFSRASLPDEGSYSTHLQIEIEAV